MVQADGNSDNAVQQYAGSAAKLRAAVEIFNSQKGQVAFVLNLGDSIDGNDTEELVHRDLEVIAQTFSHLVCS